MNEVKIKTTSEVELYEKLSALIENNFKILQQKIQQLEEKIESLFETEELTPEEEKEIEQIREEMRRGEKYPLQEVLKKYGWKEV